MSSWPMHGRQNETRPGAYSAGSPPPAREPGRSWPGWSKRAPAIKMMDESKQKRVVLLLGHGLSKRETAFVLNMHYNSLFPILRRLREKCQEAVLFDGV